MTIDDFDVNDLSGKLAVREEIDNPLTLEACHDDGHNDAGGCHNDLTNPPWHDDQTCGHDDGHYDITCHDDVPIGGGGGGHDDVCDTMKYCP